MNWSMNLRKILHWLRYTPIHPQWFAYKYERQRQRLVGQLARGRVLDIGCGRQPIKKYLHTTCNYVSLDFPEIGTNLYFANPNVLGDAHSLPFANNAFDTVLILEVLEHLPEPKIAINEAKRVLAPNGILIISMPFLYPIHDAPNDYQRWTEYGLHHIFKYESETITIHSYGKATETGVLLSNIALAAISIAALEDRSPSVILIPFLIAVIILTNITGWTLGKIFPNKTLMPIGYMLYLRK